MNIAYECKYCSRPGVITIDDPDAMFQIPKWKHLLCCNCCGDYMERKRFAIERIGSAAALLQITRATMSASSSQATEGKIREKLVSLTKFLATTVCDYYKKTNIWDVELVNMIMDRPDMCFNICHRYTRNIKVIV